MGRTVISLPSTAEPSSHSDYSAHPQPIPNPSTIVQSNQPTDPPRKATEIQPDATSIGTQSKKRRSISLPPSLMREQEVVAQEYARVVNEKTETETKKDVAAPLVSYSPEIGKGACERPITPELPPGASSPSDVAFSSCDPEIGSSKSKFSLLGSPVGPCSPPFYMRSPPSPLYPRGGLGSRFISPPSSRSEPHNFSQYE